MYFQSKQWKLLCWVIYGSVTVATTWPTATLKWIQGRNMNINTGGSIQWAQSHHSPVRKRRCLKRLLDLAGKKLTDGLDTMSGEFHWSPLMTIICPFGFRRLCWAPVDSGQSFKHAQNSHRSLPEWSFRYSSVMFPFCLVVFPTF